MRFTGIRVNTYGPIREWRLSSVIAIVRAGVEDIELKLVKGR